MVECIHKKRYISLIYLVLVVAVITAYEPMRHNDFTSYDDPQYVTENPYVTSGLTAESITWAFTNRHCLTYHPLATLSHMLDCELFGLRPFWHHAHSLLLHVLSALLLFWLLKRMTGAVWASAFVAAVFALHPLQVESVAWVSERKNVLSGFFWILTIAAYVCYAESPHLGRYIIVVIVYVLALLSKPMVVTLPFVLLLLDYWPLCRLKPKTGKNVNSEKLRYKQFSARHLVMEKLPLFVLSLILSVITLITQRSGGAISSLGDVSVKYRLANAFITYLKYIEKTVWPRELAIFYPHYGGHTPIFAAVICASVLVLLTGIFIYLARRRRYLAVGWLWFIGTLIPVIGIVQVGGQAMADRYMHIPIIGLAMVIAWGVRDITEKLKYRTIFVALSAIAVLSAAVTTTRRQVGYWRNNLTIFKHAIDVTDLNAEMHNNYGCALWEAGRVEEALTELKKAIEILPLYPVARFNLGQFLSKEGRFDEAIECFQELLKIDKDFVEAYYYLGLAYSKKHQLDQAVKYFSEALRIDPNQIEARYQLGRVFLSAGQIDSAIECFNDALRLNDKRADVYASLGMAYMKKGRLDLAVSNWNQAIELKPDAFGELNNLAWVLAAASDSNVRDPAKAVEFALRACELTDYKNPLFLDTLAVAYAAAGRFHDAVKIAEQAINLALLANRKDLADQIQGRLVLYRANKPYYDK